MVGDGAARTFGERVQAARKARGIRSAKALADLVGNPSISESILQNIETGRLANVSVSQLLNIAFALRVPPSRLMAALERPGDRIEWPNLSDGVSAMSNIEFDAWLAGLTDGAYRAQSSAELTDRNELAALRELDRLVRERKRILALTDLPSASPDDATVGRPWDRPDDRLRTIRAQLGEIATYLQTAGWSLDAWDLEG